jgi:predicted RNA-binding Zn-ribbon protein involved in translation (DUF1610 family)
MATNENGSARTCPKCGQEIDASSEWCVACGALFTAMACDRHPDRDAVGVCVICGRPVCPECDEDETVHHVCPEHSSIPCFEGWAQLYTTSDGIEAQLIRDNLEADGIDSEVLSQRDSALAFDLGDFSQVRVLVPAFAYLDAHRLLRQHMDDSGEVAFACPSCGETYLASDTTCRACGAELPRATA